MTEEISFVDHGEMMEAEREANGPPHLCRAMIGEPVYLDYSRLLHRDTIPMMDGKRIVTWAIVITGKEDQLTRRVQLTNVVTLSEDDQPIRISVYFCPWCGEKLRREP